MRKIITQSTTVSVCDLCERDCSNGFNYHCYICKRECCSRCLRLIEFGSDESRMIEFPIKVCCECEQLAPTLHCADRLEATVEGADMKVREIIGQWRMLAKKAGGQAKCDSK